MGCRNPKVLSEKAYKRYLRKLDAPIHMAYSADTTFIYQLLADFPDSTHHVMVKNQFQPVQMIYYGHSQYKNYQLINCYASGFPRLNWNKEGRLDQFPPIKGAPTDSLITFDRLMGYFKPFGHQNKYTVGPNEPYTVVIFWGRWMLKESKRLNRYLKDNIAKANEPYRIIYVNIDEVFAFE